MKLQFTTSVGSVNGGSFIEGRVIDVDQITPDLQQWLDAGVLKLVKDSGEEIPTPATVGETATTASARRSRPAKAGSE